MTKYFSENEINCNTLGELIDRDYAGFTVAGGSAPMDMDVTHGVEINTTDNREHGHGIFVSIYPYVEWTDSSYKPCHYWGMEYFIHLEKR